MIAKIRFTRPLIAENAMNGAQRKFHDGFMTGPPANHWS